MHLREEVVVEEGAQAADMHHACGAGSVPHAHLVPRDLVCAVFLPHDALHILIVLVELCIDLLASGPSRKVA